MTAAVSAALWRALFAAENRYEETSQFYLALEPEALVNLETAREAVVAAVLKSTGRKTAPPFSGSLDRLRAQAKQEIEAIQAENLTSITRTQNRNNFIFADLTALAGEVTSDPTPEVWEEKARPNHTVEITGHHKSSHWPHDLMVSYRHTGVHNKRSQSHETITEEKRFLKRFRPLPGVPAQLTAKELREAKLSAARAEAHTNGVIGPYMDYVVRHEQDRLRNRGLSKEPMTYNDWLHMLDTEDNCG